MPNKMQIAVFAENTVRAGEVALRAGEVALDWDFERESDDVIVYEGTETELRKQGAELAENGRTPFLQKVGRSLVEYLS